MLIVDTQKVRPKERFSYWVDTLSTDFFPIEAEQLLDKDGDFSGQLRARPIRDILVTRHTSSPYRLKRTRKMIARQELGMLVFGIPHSNRAVQQTLGDRVISSCKGDVVLYDVDLEHEFAGPHGTDENALLIPTEYFKPYLGAGFALKPLVFRAGHGLNAMLRAYGKAFIDLRDATPAEEMGAIQVLVHLASLAYGLHPEEDRSVSQSLAEVRLIQAAQFISANLHDPRLNVDKVARHLGISVRRLHSLYEPTGESVAKSILNARTDRARELLMRHPDKTVLEIAFACGFSNLSTFYRCFVSAAGMAPGEFRKSAT